jgi:hypothetical protein
MTGMTHLATAVKSPRETKNPRIVSHAICHQESSKTCIATITRRSLPLQKIKQPELEKYWRKPISANNDIGFHGIP